MDIPTHDAVRQIIASATGRWRAFIVVAAFCGLRTSELRGLRWGDVDLGKCQLKVNQRADRYNEIGNPKSGTSRREIPFGNFVANTLKEWKLATAFNGDGDYVFCTSTGAIDYHANPVQRGFIPAVTRALGEPKYTGLHTLRHFYASWCINAAPEPKTDPELHGTFDHYDHL